MSYNILPMTLLSLPVSALMCMLSMSYVDYYAMQFVVQGWMSFQCKVSHLHILVYKHDTYLIDTGKIMNRRGSEATFVRDQIQISENELYDITEISKVGLKYTLISTTLSLERTSCLPT